MGQIQTTESGPFLMIVTEKRGSTENWVAIKG